MGHPPAARERAHRTGAAGGSAPRRPRRTSPRWHACAPATRAARAPGELRRGHVVGVARNCSSRQPPFGEPASGTRSPPSSRACTYWIPRPGKERSSRSELKCGIRRERGYMRTSTSAATPCPRSSPTSSSSAWVECPTVKMSSSDGQHGEEAWQVRAEARLQEDARAVGPQARAKEAAAKQPRFVIHEHHARSLHWDLRLERDGVLVSWAVPKGIPPDPKKNHLAVHVEDHPLDYIDFAGRHPQGQLRRRHDEDLGQGHLRDREVPRRRGDGHLPRRAAAGQVRALPDRGQELDDPPHGPARRTGRASRCRSKLVPMLAQARDPPARRRRTRLRDQVGRHPGARRTSTAAASGS